MQGTTLKKKLYNHLISELYPYPACADCQYCDTPTNRMPCKKCKGDKWKLHKDNKEDTKNLVNGIMNIIKQHHHE